MPENQKMIVKSIIEIVGKPKDHVIKSMSLVMDKIKDQKTIKIVEEKVFEPKEVESFFSTFAELELQFQSTNQILDFCFDYMPSSVEIIEPDKLAVSSSNFGDVLNDLLSKLHTISNNVANLNAENQLLKKNGEAILTNLITLSLENGPTSIEELSRKVGIVPKQLDPFIQAFIKKGKIEKVKKGYQLVTGDGKKEN